MQLQYYTSQITKIYFAMSSASSTAVATARSTAVATANRTIEFYMGVLFLG